MKIKILFVVVICVALFSCSETNEESPLAKGMPFAEQFSNLPYLNKDIQTYQNSSTDPAEDQFNDHSHWLYTDKDGGEVLADISGPGCIYRFWSTGNHGDSNRIKIYIDGENVPRINETINEFHSNPPLSQKPQVGSGGDRYLAWWSYVPITFSKSCKIVRQDNFRPFYSITYHTYTDTSGVKSWTGNEDLSKLEAMWNNPTQDPKNKENNSIHKTLVKLEPGQKETIYQKDGVGNIASIKISNYLPEKDLRIKMYWDGEDEPSVDAPVKWFFGSVDNGGDVKALGVGTVDHSGYCYFPMPFWKEARIVLENNSDTATQNMDIEIQYNPKKYEENLCGYFHAVANENETPINKYTCLQTSGTGHVVGMAKRMPKGGHACEGDEVFYIDGRKYPDIYGTGEEDYNNNAWWTNSYNSFPTHGCVGNDCYYRIHYPDLLVFNQSIDMEFETWQPYYIASLVWFYKKDKPSVILTDSIDILDKISEKEHEYLVNGLIWSGTKTGTYPGIQIYNDSITDDGVSFDGYSQFNIKVDEKNQGVRLRLRTDNGDIQIAKVWIDNVPVTERKWKLSKNKFLATWVDADFEIPKKYTKDKDNVLVRIELDEESQKVWTEYRYEAYSYID